METQRTHWTEKSTADFLFRVGADFVAQIECKLGPVRQKDLARRLNVTDSAVSQMLHNPGNLKIDTMVKYARALGMKLSLVLYDDDDPNNERGPINAEIFKICWEKCGKPADFWAINSSDMIALTTEGTIKKNGGFHLTTSVSMNINLQTEAVINLIGNATTPPDVQSEERVYGGLHG